MGWFSACLELFKPCFASMSAQFASTDRLFRMSVVGSLVEAVWVMGCFLLVQRGQIAHIFAVHFQTVRVVQQSM